MMYNLQNAFESVCKQGIHIFINLSQKEYLYSVCKNDLLS